MAELRVAIFGCGRMGNERARCVQEAGATVVFVYDPDAERAAKMALEFGAEAIATQDDLPWSDVDAVFFCTPPHCREAQALAAIRAKVPFLAEKPIGISHAASDRVLAALTDAPVVNAIGYMNRCRASILQAKALLEDCRLLGISAHWVCRQYTVPWWLDESASGGPMNEQATHLFDLCRFLGGEVEEVTSLAALNGSHAVQPLGSASALRFSSGILGTIFYSCESSVKDIGLHLFTDKGGIELSGWDFQMTSNMVTNTLPLPSDENVFLTETRVFLEAVESGSREKVACDWEEAARTQLLVDAARRSMSEERELELQT
ncbi:Gfo/Idh/MocA family protein [Terriglobus saanensis]|uniref:Oxidoreductase domain protein n=1 Tax=Terriglobus saanensis (strain ATCC BAA-1853 / DSM 23119 / SP1PR4) TaxID=401053 RepID=E8UYH1_TERSS|nr:Gfo/Idh/MocA family oxidoreductase [Terriglobus saanensis]ADV82059.1 oxidoreductase domain protein [Terriglobus saanensis SP1PR4]